MKRPKLDIDAFHAQFHNHDHYRHHESGEHRHEWWELPEPRKRGARVDFRNGGRIGYADGGGVEQLQQNLRGAFSTLNQQVAAAPQQQAPAGGDYKAMLERATQPSLSPDYQAMVNKALAPSGKTYEEMFPANVKPYAPAAAATPAAAAADALPYYQTNYGYSPTEILGGDGSSSGAADAGGGTGGAGAAGADGSGGDGGASSSGGGSAYRYGGQTIFRRNGVKKSNIVERALAVTRRK